MARQGGPVRGVCLGERYGSLAMARGPAVPQDQGMLGLRPPIPDRNRETTTARKRRSATDEPLPRATESLMRNAAAVRRAAAAPSPAAELSMALGHIEGALADLSHGMARMASAVKDQDLSSGGLAWRLQTLGHALAAARHLCSRVRAVVPRPDSGVAGSSRQVDDASPA
jgi:hypothetical protein